MLDRMPEYTDRGVVNQAVIAMKRHPKLLAAGVAAGVIGSQLPSLVKLAYLHLTGLV